MSADTEDSNAVWTPAIKKIKKWCDDAVAIASTVIKGDYGKRGTHGLQGSVLYTTK
jgi:hypothetical protein